MDEDNSKPQRQAIFVLPDGSTAESLTEAWDYFVKAVPVDETNNKLKTQVGLADLKAKVEWIHQATGEADERLSQRQIELEASIDDHEDRVLGHRQWLETLAADLSKVWKKIEGLEAGLLRITEGNVRMDKANTERFNSIDRTADRALRRVGVVESMLQPTDDVGDEPLLGEGETFADWVLRQFEKAEQRMSKLEGPEKRPMPRTLSRITDLESRFQHMLTRLNAAESDLKGMKSSQTSASLPKVDVHEGTNPVLMIKSEWDRALSRAEHRVREHLGKSYSRAFVDDLCKVIREANGRSSSSYDH